ncbi:HAD family hydrolase [Candidatus Sumerlaeota bacterium]|nr:HAD family hydrolase [Candidatus Sumerlaeota bacterium]
MSQHTPDVLKQFQPAQQCFIGIDSDGCVFDSMEIKQKECFAPQFIKHFGLQPVSRYAREVWEFVNLYSKSRGCNRFLALARSFDLLARRPEVLARNVQPIDYSPLKAWTQVESKLSSKTISKYLDEHPDAHPFMQRCKAWSLAVDAAVKDIVENVPPFPFFRESVEMAKERADILVISSTPCEALEREWAEHDIARYASVIAGSEMGSKKEHLEYAAKGKYGAGKILMIGDAPGDQQAAQHIGAAFYPIIPHHEEESWERFHNEALDKFFNGSFDGEYAAQLDREFDASLPENPSWKQVEPQIAGIQAN